MANNYLDQLKLPNNSIYYLRDNEAIGSLTRTGSSLIVANRVGTQTVIPNTDFDTINVTELNAGNLIVTGAARFLNPINGSITGQAGSVANSLVIQLNSGTTEGTNKFTYNGSASKTVNITKSSIGLGNVENKSSATIRSEITSSNVTTALGYTPATSTHTHDTSIAASSGTNQLSLSANTKYSITAGGTSFIFTTPPDNNTTYTFAESSSNGYFTVTPSGGSAQSVKIHGLGTSAFKNTTDTYSETGTDPVTGKALKQALDGLPEPMVFKGTVGSSSATYTWDQLPTPSASNEGWTFKAIENHSTAPICKNGDTLISNGSEWVIVPSGDEPSGTVTSVAIANGGGLSVSGSPITSSGTITISHSDTSSQASVSNSGRTYIQSVTLDTYGHVTKLTSATETVTDTNYYHKTGTWSGLTYTAAKVGSPDDLTFTIPTGTTATTVALGNHNHDGVYLKLSGGTMTGVLALKGSQYEDSYSGALNANNSNIYNLNSIYTADVADAASEGIHFYRDASHVDSLWVSGGDIMFVPNRALGTSTTAANSQKVGRFTANPTSGQVVITDGTTGGMKSSGYTIASSVPANAKFTDTTYTIGTSGNNVTLTPSSGSAQSITVPYSTSAGSATNDSSGNKIVDTYIPLKTSGGVKGCSGGGSYIYYQLATIVITTSYRNYPILFEMSGRGFVRSNIQVIFKSVNGVDPALDSFITDGYTGFYIKKTDTSTWVIYGSYTEKHGTSMIHRITGSGYNSGTSITVDMTNYGNELPEETTQVVYGWNSSYATKASQDESGNNIKASYASSFSISDHTITLKNKNGDSLGTVTVPDNNTTYGLSASNDSITLTAGGTGTTVQAHLCYNIAIGNTTDWNTLQNAGAYKVQMSSWGDATTYHSPNSYNSNLYSFGMLYIVKSGVSAENRIFQYYIPHSTAYPTLVRSHNSSSSWDNGWSTWYPIYNGMTLAKETIGSASAGTAISADDITAWDAGATPTLGTAISADDITAWSAGTMFSASFDGKCTLSLTSGSVPTLSYTGRSIPNVTSVGSVPTLSYTARSIPNISVSSKTVVTGIS